MNDREWLGLIGRISSGVANDEELGKYNAWCNACQTAGSPVKDFAAVQDLMLANINQKINHTRSIRLRYYKVASIAAVIAVVVGGWFFYVSDNYHQSELYTSSHFANDVPPGKNAATITLGNGKILQLSNSKNGIVIDDSNLKYNDGSVVERGDLKEGNMLTTITPRGGTYQVTLSDGSQVWMNADSKIIFPVKFSGKSREVLLEGEAYFEVTKDKNHPFIVKTEKQKVKVLGTHFNVAAYRDELVTKTTLLEGSVEVVAANGNLLKIKPGEQTHLANNTFTISNADIDEAVAWKNGEFMFSNEPLESIMNKVSRWYDVDIKFQSVDAKRKTFNGTITRFEKVSKVLKMLELTGHVHFKIEGKVITVLN